MKKTNVFFNLLITAGVVLLIGTAGASDSDILSLSDTLLQILFSALIIFLGLAGNVYISKFKRRKKKKIDFITEIAA